MGRAWQAAGRIEDEMRRRLSSPDEERQTSGRVKEVVDVGRR
jgi:hypothetical protein